MQSAVDITALRCYLVLADNQALVTVSVYIDPRRRSDISVTNIIRITETGHTIE